MAVKMTLRLKSNVTKLVLLKTHCTWERTIKIVMRKIKQGKKRDIKTRNMGTYMQEPTIRQTEFSQRRGCANHLKPIDCFANQFIFIMTVYPYGK